MGGSGVGGGESEGVGRWSVVWASERRAEEEVEGRCECDCGKDAGEEENGHNKGRKIRVAAKPAREEKGYKMQYCKMNGPEKKRETGLEEVAPGHVDDIGAGAVGGMQEAAQAGCLGVFARDVNK